MNDELPFGKEPEVADPENIRKIDAMPYREMLRMVRCAPLGDPLFRGKTGIYFHATMKAKRHELSDEARVAISKEVGF